MTLIEPLSSETILVARVFESTHLEKTYSFFEFVVNSANFVWSAFETKN